MVKESTMKSKTKNSIKSSIGNTAVNRRKNKLSAAKKITTLAEHVLAQFPEYLYWTDTQGVFLGCNSQVANYLGFRSSHEIIGKTVSDIGQLLQWENSI